MGKLRYGCNVARPGCGIFTGQAITTITPNIKPCILEEKVIKLLEIDVSIGSGQSWLLQESGDVFCAA